MLKVDKIGNYFSSPEALILFNCRDNEMVDDCLSRRKDMFDDVINHKKSIEDLVNKSSEDNGRLTSSQGITMLQKIQYLRMAYLNVINSDLNKIVSFKTCCDEAIKQMSQVGVSYIRNANTIMQWNRIFRNNEIFPHPNIYVEMGKSETPLFLETFPEVKVELSKFARNNVNQLNCETVTLHLRENIVPKIYEKMKKDCQVDNQPTYQDFLAAFNLKSISSVTTWRWMKSIGFSYCEREKNYFTDKREDQNNREYRIKFIEKYFTLEKNTYRWIHLKEKDAKKMEQDTDNPLLENSYIEFIHDNEKMREYHIDTHSSFSNCNLFKRRLST